MGEFLIAQSVVMGESWIAQWVVMGGLDSSVN